MSANSTMELAKTWRMHRVSLQFPAVDLNEKPYFLLLSLPIKKGFIMAVNTHCLFFI